MKMATVVLAVASSGAAHLNAQTSRTATSPEAPILTRQSQFYCNLKALSPGERSRHKQLTEKLASARKKVVQTMTGYEFQFNPAAVSLANLAEWVTDESKCCPFFNFQINMNSKTGALRLQLSGDEGVKAFIRAEFNL